jgi:hypothetical protein
MIHPFSPEHTRVLCLHPLHPCIVLVTCCHRFDVARPLISKKRHAPNAGCAGRLVTAAYRQGFGMQTERVAPILHPRRRPVPSCRSRRTRWTRLVSCERHDIVDVVLFACVALLLCVVSLLVVCFRSIQAFVSV